MSRPPADSPTRHAAPRFGGAAPGAMAVAGPEFTLPGELGAGGASGFGGSMLGALPPETRPVPDGSGSAFDVCHIGVVLRAVLLVQGVLALGVTYTAATAVDWVLLFARGSIGSVWAVLSWLVLGCAAKRWLSVLPAAAQWAAAVGLGAACAALGWGLLCFSGLMAPIAHVALAVIASGAAMAGALFYWLRLRALAALPADTTARLAELQSRIRPHFLFNTLNTAVTLVRVDPARAEAVLEDLAELFRVALTATGEVATLGAEVELAKRYLAIEQLRFGDRLRIHWEIEPQCAGAKVPPLLLQPLVENAVRHGIEPSAAGGSIRVRARARRGHAVIDIVNSVSATASLPGHGIALHNVRERLRLMHDVAAQFEARREQDSYRVQIVVPLG